MKREPSLRDLIKIIRREETFNWKREEEAEEGHQLRLGKVLTAWNLTLHNLSPYNRGERRKLESAREHTIMHLFMRRTIRAGNSWITDTFSGKSVVLPPPTGGHGGSRGPHRGHFRMQMAVSGRGTGDSGTMERKTPSVCTSRPEICPSDLDGVVFEVCCVFGCKGLAMCWWIVLN